MAAEGKFPEISEDFRRFQGTLDDGFRGLAWHLVNGLSEDQARWSLWFFLVLSYGGPYSPLVAQIIDQMVDGANQPIAAEVGRLVQLFAHPPEEVKTAAKVADQVHQKVWKAEKKAGRKAK